MTASAAPLILTALPLELAIEPPVIVSRPDEPVMTSPVPPALLMSSVAKLIGDETVLMSTPSLVAPVTVVVPVKLIEPPESFARLMPVAAPETESPARLNVTPLLLDRSKPVVPPVIEVLLIVVVPPVMPVTTTLSPPEPETIMLSSVILALEFSTRMPSPVLVVMAPPEPFVVPVPVTAKLPVTVFKRIPFVPPSEETSWKVTAKAAFAMLIAWPDETSIEPPAIVNKPDEPDMVKPSPVPALLISSVLNVIGTATLLIATPTVVELSTTVVPPKLRLPPEMLDIEMPVCAPLMSMLLNVKLALEFSTRIPSVLLASVPPEPAAPVPFTANVPVTVSSTMPLLPPPEETLVRFTFSASSLISTPSPVPPEMLPAEIVNPPVESDDRRPTPLVVATFN